ncbi:MAG: transcriptional regulator, partial [Halobaculum sp.]
MDSEIVDVVTDWGSRSFDGGYDGLRELEAEEFTGAVTEGLAWLFFLNGRIVGVFDGSLADFETADGTAYEAPDPSLPLLFSMLETGGETKAQYYTEDTPISSADETLSSGSFTGYVELSENVLSGDYYVVYYGGRKLPCAFVGQSRDILTGEEAFERAADEVGIYEVKDVEIEIVELPEAEDDETDTESDESSGRSTDEQESGASDRDDSGSETAASAGTDADETDVSVSMNGGETRREATGAADVSGSDTAESSDPDRAGSAGTESTAGTEPVAESDAESDADGDPAPHTPAEAETEAAVTRREGERERVESAGSTPGGDTESADSETAEASNRPDTESGGEPADADDPD